MPRIPAIRSKEDLAPEHHAVYDGIVKSRGQVQGPFAMLMHSPPVAERTAHLGAYVRFESTLDAKDEELAVITAAREMDCEYEWAAHVPQARRAGVREDTIAAIRDRKAPEGLGDDERLVVGYVQQLLRRHRVDDSTYRAMQDRFGVRGLVELTATIGYYGMLACTLNAFQMEPAGSDTLPA